MRLEHLLSGELVETHNYASTYTVQTDTLVLEKVRYQLHLFESETHHYASRLEVIGLKPGL